MNTLEKWLLDPRFAEYIGDSFAFKLDVARAVLAGNESLADVARRHGKTKQAAQLHAARLRGIFANGQG